MPRITVNVPEDVEKWLHDEADRLNWSKADAGGHCIEVIHRTAHHIDVNQLDADDPFSTEAGEGHTDVDGISQVDEFIERLKELEAQLERMNELEDRVEELKQRLGDRETTVDSEAADAPREHSPDETSPDHDEPVQEDERRQETATRDDVQADEVVEAIVADVSASWDEDNRLDDRRDAARAALQLMRERGILGRTDAVEALLPEYGVEGQNERTWWRQNIRDAVAKAGSYSRGRSAYVWDLDEDAEGDDTDSDTGGVYDPTDEFE